MHFATHRFSTFYRTFYLLLNGSTLNDSAWLRAGMLSLILALGVGLAKQSQAQVPQNIITGDVDRPKDVHAADLNGDGSPDVLSASSVDDKIAWYENTDEGISSQKIISTTAGFARSVYAADLTGNDLPDVLSASSRDDKIAWYRNSDDGTFSDQKVIATDADNPRSIFAADVNADDQTDVLYAGSKITWYENNGDGSFSAPNVIAEDGLARSVFVVDLTGNGDPDILSAFYDKIAWYENNGDGTFSEQKVITTDIDQGRSVYAADLTGNGVSDVVSASSGDSKVAWYENNGDKTFSDQNVITTEAFDARSVYAADLTGSGALDVLSASDGGLGVDGKIAWYENNGDGAFSDQMVITTDLVEPRDVHAADVAGSDQADVLFASGSTTQSKIAWQENKGDSSFSAQRTITPTADDPRSVYATDLTGSGRPDVLSASEEDDKIAWYENNGDGTFSEQNVITTEADGAESVYAADLTGNGEPDVLSASKEDDKIAWYENNGDGTFSNQQVITTDASGAQSVYVADLTGNDQSDVLSASKEDDKIAWYENNGDGTFSDQKVITTNATNAQSVSAADLNGDGNLDILAGLEGPGNVVWYGNNGDGTFSDEKVINDDGFGFALSVHATDLNDDGSPDVLAAVDVVGFPAPEVVFFENNGDGTFTDEKVINEGDAESVYAADLSGNGELDVLSASESSYWYRNTGDGIVSNRKVISDDGATSVYAADLTGNGQPDVLSASSGDDKIAWYENTDDTLPVELAGLDATVDGDAVKLSWTTAAETGNAGFRVQRRRDAETEGRGDWTTIGRKQGAGTTTEAQSYRFTDADLPYEADALTYRLKQVDTDGSAHFSDLVTVERSVDELQLLGTYPNPASQQATVRYTLPEQQDATLRLYDALGRQVRSVARGQQEGRHEQRLDLSGLSSGVYFLRLSAAGQTRTQKLTVVR